MSMPDLNSFKRFDVRPLIRAGVEPLPQIMNRLDEIKPGAGLIIVAPFLPSPLIERLRALGYSSKLERGSAPDWMVYFWRDAD
jgi:hypothetical protein